MPLHRTVINTEMLNPELGMSFDIPVFYTDELIETSVFNLAFSSALGGFLPYLFVGYFTDGKDYHQWFFSNARRHEEMHEAIEHDLGKKYDYVYGQIWFSQTDLQEGELRFNQLVMHADTPDAENALALLRKSIKPEYLKESFIVTKAKFH